ncbi:MAG: glycoside hydrolase family 71/99-like protein [Akkermansiaceae bacterium]
MNQNSKSIGRVLSVPLIAGIGLTLVNCLQEKANSEPSPADTLTGKVMSGYQGWFHTPEDGLDLGWKHYRHSSSQDFKPGYAGIDYWPDMSELAEHERFNTSFKHADGRTAQVFSSGIRDTVVRHFKWMEDYGIDGVFLQRFGTEVTTQTDRADHKQAQARNTVLDHVRAGAEKHNRTWVVMYDLSSMKAKQLRALREDWRFLVREKKIFESPMYQNHKKAPVVAIWGVGFKNRDYGPKEVLELVDFFKNDPVFGGMTVMLGTSTGWRTGERDAMPFADWKAVYQAADIISPWTVGRYRTPTDARRYFSGRAKDDRAWCLEREKDFLPVLFPGFSWANLKKNRAENADAFIDRLGGNFLWTQYDAAIQETGTTMIYQAMFDELDEGTHIFKSTNDVPIGESKFQTYGDLPSDHYLWLVGEAAKRLRGEIEPSSEMPERIE